MFQKLVDYLYYLYLDWEARSYIPGQYYRDAEFREMLRKDKFGEIY